MKELRELQEQLDGDPTQALEALEAQLREGPADAAELRQWFLAVGEAVAQLALNAEHLIVDASTEWGPLDQLPEVHPAHEGPLGALRDPEGWFRRFRRRLSRTRPAATALNDDLEEALLAALAGHNEEALWRCDRALEKASQVAPTWLPRVSLVRAKVLELADDPSAEQAWADAARQWRGLDDDAVGRALVGFARVLQDDLDRMPEREQALDTACQLGAALGESRILIEATILRAHLALQRDEPQQALDLFVRGSAGLRVMGRDDELLEQAMQVFSDHDARFAEAIDGLS